MFENDRQPRRSFRLILLIRSRWVLRIGNRPSISQNIARSKVHVPAAGDLKEDAGRRKPEQFAKPANFTVTRPANKLKEALAALALGRCVEIELAAAVSACYKVHHFTCHCRHRTHRPRIGSPILPGFHFGQCRPMTQSIRQKEGRRVCLVTMRSLTN